MRALGRSSWPELGAATAALLVGAWLRLYALDFAQFRPDDESLWSLARGLIEQPRVLTRGIPSSFGLSNGPFQVYLLAPGAALSSGPEGAYVVVALLNVVGLAAFWLFVRAHWGGRAAIVALLLAATNPWAVLFSRRLLGNDLLAPFTVLLVGSLSAWIARGRARDLLLAFLWLTVAIQTYVVALLHLPLMALGLVLGRAHLRAGHFALGTTILAVGSFPYAARAVARELGAPARLVEQTDRVPAIDLDSLRLMLHLVSSEGYQAFASQLGSTVDATEGWPLLVSLLSMAAMVVGMCLVAARAYQALRAGLTANAAPGLLALLAVLLPALLLVRHLTPIHPYYLVTGLPMQYLFVAVGLSEVARLVERVARSAPAARIALASAVAAIVATHLALAQLFFGGVRGYWSLNDYGLPLAYTRELASVVRQAAAEAGAARVLLVGGEEHTGVLHRMLERDLPESAIFDPTEAVVVPASSVSTVLYVLADPADPVGAAIAAAPLSRRVGSFEVPGDGLAYHLVAASPARLAELFEREISGRASAQFGDRVGLDGFASDPALTPGRTERLTLGWRISETSVGGPDLIGFVRLVDTQERSLGGRDFPLVSATHWQPGDRVLSWLSLAVPGVLPPGSYAYRVGLYTTDPTGAYQVLPVRDPRGALAGETVRLGWRAVLPARAPEPTHRVDERLGGAVRLVGYDLRDPGCAAPRRIELVLHWSTERSVEQDYTVFVHVVAPDRKIVAQRDAQPADGRFPTSGWPVGERLVDAHTIELPRDAPAGLRALVGLYSQPSGERLGGPDAVIALPTGPADCPRA
jgi:4-amino-4-deoxy-L-arabinose transferase-like glycosyltransferase